MSVPKARLSINTHRLDDAAMAERGMRTAIQALSALPAVFELSLELTAGGGQSTQASFLVSGPDSATAIANALVARQVITAINPWMEMEDPVPVVDSALPGSATVYDLVEIAGPGPDVRHHFSPSLTLASTLPTQTTVRIHVREITIEPDEPVRGIVMVEFIGESMDIASVAGTMAAELCGPTRFGTRLRRMGTKPEELDLPIETVGWLLSTPTRLSEKSPTQHPSDPQVLMNMFSETIPPHAAVFGGSGLGKTTFLIHRALQFAQFRGPVVTLCAHGDISSALAAVLEHSNIEFEAIDFGNVTEPPAWNLLAPPRGIRPEDWVDVTADIVLSRWREQGLTTEMAGPMWHFCFLAAAGTLIRDPQGVWPITELPGLLTSPKLSDRWSRALHRIGDADLTRRVSEARDAIAHDKEMTFAPWMMSKLQFVTSSARMKRIVGNRRSSFDVSRVLDGVSLLISVPHAHLGSEGASILATGVVQQLWQLVRLQKAASRHKILVVIDEAQLFNPILLSSLLAESRKFGLEILLATQSPRSLEPELLTSVLANCGTIGTFRVGPADAAVLDQRYPSIPMGKMQRLSRFQLAVTNGETDVIARAPAPLFDPSDTSAFETAHRKTLARYETFEPHETDNGQAPPATDLEPWEELLRKTFHITP